jgi:hypothetical protein
MARGRNSKQESAVVEELNFRSDDAFLCLLVNRRAKYIRVIDFRAGSLPAKRLFIQSVAQRENIEKVITLVEKDEVSSWTRVGFVREGTVPGFYKRSDGYLVGCVIGDRAASVQVDDEDDKITERTLNAAKKAAKDLATEQAVDGVVLKGVSASRAARARDHVWSKGEGLGSFDPFGRDALRLFLEVTPKRGKPNYLSAEFQECFGHSLIEILRAPKGDAEIAAVYSGLNSFSEELKRRGVVSGFGFSSYEDVALATAFVAAGFRKTGLLAQGMLCGPDTPTAILWTRKLADPAGGGEPLEDIENDEAEVTAEEEDEDDTDREEGDDEDEEDDVA